MTESEALTELTLKLKGISALFSAEELTACLRDAKRETRWTLPITGSAKGFWFIRRAFRHALYLLCVENARKFKYRQASMHQRFEHYLKLIEFEDKAWAEAELPLDTDAERAAVFGHVATTGFAYDALGRDVTHSSRNRVIINPLDGE